MAKKTAKNIFQALFFAVVFFLTYWYVFRDENLPQVFSYLQTADIRFVIPSVIFVILFILGDSAAVYYLLWKLDSRSSFFRCCLFSFIGFFYCAITPSASGGQPMQLLAMRRSGIASAVSIVVLGIVTIAYKMVLVVVGALVLLLRPECIMRYLDGVEPLMYLGLILNVGFIAVLFLAIFWPTAIRAAAHWLLNACHRVHLFRKTASIDARLEKFLEQYSGTAEFLRRHPLITLNVFVISLVQRFCLFAVVWMTYLAFGLSGESGAVIVLLYAMISVAVDMLPLPGGMGISETLFLEIYEPIFSEALVLPGMLVCRGISYYTQLAISGLLTFASSFILRPKKHRP